MDSERVIGLHQFHLSLVRRKKKQEEDERLRKRTEKLPLLSIIVAIRK